MKKLLTTGLLVGLAVSAFAQGQINLSNSGNTNQSPTATSSGLFFFNNGSGPVLANADFNASFYGGTDAASLVLLKTISGAAAIGVNAFGPGTFTDLSGNFVSIPGSLTSGFLRIDAWLGPAADYNSATGIKGTSGAFSNPLGNPQAQPPGTPTDLANMPAVVLAGAVIPEPSTFALAGLGAAALLIFRRRK
jgi:hypothetical protein